MPLNSGQQNRLYPKHDLKLAKGEHYIISSNADGEMVYKPANHADNAYVSQIVLQCHAIPFSVSAITGAAAGVLDDAPHNPAISGSGVTMYFTQRYMVIPSEVTGATISSVSVGSYLAAGTDAVVGALYLASGDPGSGGVFETMSGSTGLPTVPERVIITGSAGYQTTTLDVSSFGVVVGGGTIAAGDILMFGVATGSGVSTGNPEGLTYSVTFDKSL